MKLTRTRRGDWRLTTPRTYVFLTDEELAEAGQLIAQAVSAGNATVYVSGGEQK